jgi:hypothetical protein
MSQPQNTSLDTSLGELLDFGAFSPERAFPLTPESALCRREWPLTLERTLNI